MVERQRGVMFTVKPSWVRVGLIAAAIGGAVSLTGCSEVAAHSSLHNFKMRAKQIRNEVKIMRPGELGTMLDGLDDEKLRYVAYRAVEAQRERLRAGRDQWASLDTYALLETAKLDMNADYQPLRGVAKAHYVWARLESMEPGLVATMMDGPHADAVVGWVADFQRQGRPLMEGRLDRYDLAALQKYAMARLPETRSLLRFTFEQDQRPGQVAGFLSRDWSEEQLTEIMRLWCSAEGWSPLAHGGDLTARERNAVHATLERLKQAKDPLLRREATRWKTWFDSRSTRLTKLR